MADEFASHSQIIDVDPLTRSVQRMTITPDQQLVLETKTDITDLAEFNREQANNVSRTTRSGDMVHVARLPITVLYDLKTRGILDDQTAFKKWLASDEARPFKTHWMTS